MSSGDEQSNFATTPDADRRGRLVRVVGLCVLLAAIITAAALLLGTERGRALAHHPSKYGHEFQRWVSLHPVAAPVAYISAYVLLGTLALPVWWMQILAGYGFGLFFGIVYSAGSATLASVGAAATSRFLLGDWFRRRVESQLLRIRQLDEKLGHNGLLVVCAVRLAHFIPAGLSNFAFGLTRITLRDIALGTLLGGTPGVSTFVILGAAKHLLEDWRYIAGVVAANVVLIGVLVARYLRPQWFKRIGVE